MDVNNPTHLDIFQRLTAVETKLDVKFSEISRRLDALENSVSENAERAHKERVELEHRLDSVERTDSENKGRDRVFMGGIALVVSGAVGTIFRWIGAL